MEDWTQLLPTITAGYDLKDVFNADETGLYFRALPQRSMTHASEDGKGVKVSREHLTVQVACSATEEKLPLLMIGKAANLRCFHGYEKAALVVRWEHNTKAWVTLTIFRHWLERLNNSMVLRGRHILLFIEKCTAHPDVQVSNVHIQFLPKNTTSKLQPCDAGVIQTLKLHYRKRLLRHLLHKMDDCNSSADLAKKVTALDAIFWLHAAWSVVHAGVDGEAVL